MAENTMAMIPIAKSAQPAEDQKIEAAFAQLEQFIASHTEKFYDLSKSLPGTTFDFEPSGTASTKVALRRYIARNILQLIDVGNNNSTVIPRLSEEKCRTKLHENLERYTLDLPEQKENWRKHLDGIIQQGTELSKMLSSQGGTMWSIGPLFPATTKPPNVIDVLVFPSLRKEGKEIRPERKLRGTKKPKSSRLGTASSVKFKEFFRRRNSGLERTPKSPTTIPGHGLLDDARFIMLLHLLDLAIYLLESFRHLLQDWGYEKRDSQLADQSNNPKKESESSLLNPKRYSFPRGNWTKWDTAISEIQRAERPGSDSAESKFAGPIEGLIERRRTV